jgi:hypothetical protein
MVCAGGSALSALCAAALRRRVTGRVGVHPKLPAKEFENGSVNEEQSAQTNKALRVFPLCHSLLPAAQRLSGHEGSKPGVYHPDKINHPS